MVKKIIQLNNFSATFVLISFQIHWDRLEIQFNPSLYLADLEEEPGSSPFEPITVEDMPPVAIDVRFVLCDF